MFFRLIFPFDFFHSFLVIYSFLPLLLVFFSLFSLSSSFDLMRIQILFIFSCIFFYRLQCTSEIWLVACHSTVHLLFFARPPMRKFKTHSWFLFINSSKTLLKSFFFQIQQIIAKTCDTIFFSFLKKLSKLIWWSKIDCRKKSVFALNSKIQFTDNRCGHVIVFSHYLNK